MVFPIQLIERYQGNSFAFFISLDVQRVVFKIPASGTEVRTKAAVGVESHGVAFA